MKGLECSKCAENIMNRKISLFTSKLYPTFLSTLKKTHVWIGLKKTKTTILDMRADMKSDPQILDIVLFGKK